MTQLIWNNNIQWHKNVERSKNAVLDQELKLSQAAEYKCSIIFLTKSLRDIEIMKF